jgi:hypothetical protein
MFRSFALALLLFATLAWKPVPAVRILHISVTAREEVSIDGVPIDISELLSKELQNRLWRSFMGNGKMPDRIDLQFEESAPAVVRTSIIKSIKEGQEKTLNVLCLHKYKKSSTDIKSKQRSRLQKQFPVLFQTF